jgi:cytochrome c oxidase subunit 2
MDSESSQVVRKILIASANPLFGKGLQKLFEERWGGRVRIIGLTTTVSDTVKTMAELKPDLVVVDYDDKTISRTNILNEFVEGEGPMQVILVSLKGNGAAVVYDRQTLTPSQTGSLLDLPALQPSIQKMRPPRGGNMRRFITVFFIVAVATTLIYLALSRTGILPVEASQQAQPIDRLFNLHFIAIAFLFSLIVGFMLYSVVAFRRRKGEIGDGVFRRGNNRLEIIWTIVPLVTVLVISTIGAANLAQTTIKDPQAMVVNVIAGQWFWSFEYPDTGITSETLNLPVNRQVLLRMTSRDVIHSFWVPEFRVKQDVLPGDNLVKELRITPTIVGDYKVRCAEMCGASHAYMESPVIVMEPTDFEAWMQEQVGTVNANPADRGAKIAATSGCVGCHTTDGSVGVGPTWKGLFGSQVTLESGETVTADEAYLLEAIVHPRTQIHQGFNPELMPPSYGQVLTESQIQDLIEFIKSLK